MNSIALTVHNILQPHLRKKNGLAMTIFLFDVVVYLTLLMLSIWLDVVALKIGVSLALGLMTGLLFIVGHDCCHGSFMTDKRWNRWIGTLAFLPALHGFKLWDLGHNQTHHCFTNLSTEDYVFTSLSPDEYRALKYFEKLQYRIYRSVPGHSLYYLVEIWARKMVIPHRGIPRVGEVQWYRTDTIILGLYAIVVSITVSIVAIVLGKSVVTTFFFSLLLPFLVWNWIMGFVIYQHHTNKFTRWYRSKEEWHFWEAQLMDTVYLEFPKPINYVLHNIMEHNAHHCNMDIPLYNLPQAQACLSQFYGDKIEKISWTPAYYLETVRSCQLYDYKKHQWLRFRDL